MEYLGLYMTFFLERVDLKRFSFYGQVDVRLRGLRFTPLNSRIFGSREDSPILATTASTRAIGVDGLYFAGNLKKTSVREDGCP